MVAVTRLEFRYVTYDTIVNICRVSMVGADDRTRIRHQNSCIYNHVDVIKWKYFPRYWPFLRGINRSPVNSPHKDQWRGALMLSLICAWIDGWINNRDAGELRPHRAHYDVTLMMITRTGRRCRCRISNIYMYPILVLYVSAIIPTNICITSKQSKPLLNVDNLTHEPACWASTPVTKP